MMNKKANFTIKQLLGALIAVTLLVIIIIFLIFNWHVPLMDWIGIQGNIFNNTQQEPQAIQILNFNKETKEVGHFDGNKWYSLKDKESIILGKKKITMKTAKEEFINFWWSRNDYTEREALPKEYPLNTKEAQHKTSTMQKTNSFLKITILGENF